MRQLASYPRQNGVAAALRELGRLERTLFMLDWIDDPELRRDTGRELGRASHASAGAPPDQNSSRPESRFVRACCKMRRSLVLTIVLLVIVLVRQGAAAASPDWIDWNGEILLPLVRTIAAFR